MNTLNKDSRKILNDVIAHVYAWFCVCLMAAFIKLWAADHSFPLICEVLEDTGYGFRNMCNAENNSVYILYSISILFLRVQHL